MQKYLSQVSPAKAQHSLTGCREGALTAGGKIILVISALQRPTERCQATELHKSCLLQEKQCSEWPKWTVLCRDTAPLERCMAAQSTGSLLACMLLSKTSGHLSSVVVNA